MENPSIIGLSCKGNASQVSLKKQREKVTTLFLKIKDLSYLHQNSYAVFNEQYRFR